MNIEAVVGEAVEEEFAAEWPSGSVDKMRSFRDGEDSYVRDERCRRWMKHEKDTDK